jgi:hypothetical protein
MVGNDFIQDFSSRTHLKVRLHFGDLDVDRRIILKRNKGAESEHVSPIHPVTCSVETVTHHVGPQQAKENFSTERLV